MSKMSAYPVVPSFLDSDYFPVIRANGDGTFSNYKATFAASKAAQTISTLATITDVLLSSVSANSIIVWDGAHWVNKKRWAVNTQAASYTLALTDAYSSVRMNVAAANSLTIPPESAANFDIGTQIEVIQSGAGVTTITPGVGVTINSSAALAATAQHQKGLLIKVAADTWNFVWLGSGSGAGGGVPSGGTTGQVLVKQSGVDGAVAWTGVGDVTTTALNAGAHAYWRIQYVSGNNGTFLSAFDIQFRQAAGVTEHPTGGTVLEAHTRSGFLASDAFDANDTTRWALDSYANLNAAYLGYHYATPISVAEVRMFVSNTETPNSYNIQYSDDGVAWTTALAVTGQTNWATEVLHAMPSTTTVVSHGLQVPLAKLSDVSIPTISPANKNQPLVYQPGAGVVWSKSYYNDGVATVTLPQVPTVGNYIVMIGSSFGGGTLLRAGNGVNGWKLLQTSGPSSRDYVDIMVRKVVAGDTTTLNLGSSPSQAKISLFEVCAPSFDLTVTNPSYMYNDQGGAWDNTQWTFNEGNVFTTASTPCLVLVHAGWNQGAQGSFNAPFDVNQDNSFTGNPNAMNSWLMQSAPGVVSVSGVLPPNMNFQTCGAVAFPLATVATNAWKAGPTPATRLTQMADASVSFVKEGDLLTYDRATQKWKNKDPNPVNTQTGNYTLVQGDGYGTVRMNVATANTLTIPPESSVFFRIGTLVEVNQTGAGLTTIAPGAGVTLNTAGALVSTTQHQKCFLLKVASNTWNVAWVGGASSGGGSLATLSDAVIASPADGQVLTYEAASAKWKNKAATGGTGSSSVGTTGNTTNVVAYLHATGLATPAISDSKNCSLSRLAAGVYKFTFLTAIPAHCVPSVAATFNNDAADDTGLYCSISRNTTYSADVTWVNSIIINTRRHTDGTLLDPQNLRLTMTDPTALMGGGINGVTLDKDRYAPPLVADFPVLVGTNGTNPNVAFSATTGCVIGSGSNFAVGDNIRGAFRNLPAGSWTVVTKVKSLHRNLNYATSGLTLRESATGKMETFGFDTTTFGLIRWNSPTSYNSTPKTYVYGFLPEWFKINFDGTNLNYYTSHDGVNWTYLAVYAKAAFFTTAPDQAGFAHHISQQTAGDWTPSGTDASLSYVYYYDDGGLLASSRAIATGSGGGTGTGSWVPPRCRLTRAADFTPTGWQPIPWTTEIVDDLNAHDNVTNNTRITIPAGVTKARIHFYLIHNNVGGSQYVNLIKNGTTSIQVGISNAPNEGAFDAINTGWISVTPGDYFEVNVSGQTIVGTTNAAGYGGGSYVEAEFDNNTNGLPLEYTPFKQTDSAGFTTWTPGSTTLTDAPTGSKALLPANAALTATKAVTPGATSGVLAVDMRQAMSNNGGTLISALDPTGNVGYLFGITYSGSLATLALAIYNCDGTGVWTATDTETKVGFYPNNIAYRVRDDGTTIFFDLSYDDGATWQNYATRARSARLTAGVKTYKFSITAPACPSMALIKQMKAS